MVKGKVKVKMKGRVGYKHRSINSGIKAKPCFFLAAKREMVKM